MDKLPSIIIPVYNTEKYLHLSIESVLKNDYLYESEQYICIQK